MNVEISNSFDFSVEDALNEKKNSCCSYFLRFFYYLLFLLSFVCNRDLSLLIPVPFDGASSGGKGYGTGQRRLSLGGSFRKRSENLERIEK